MYYSRWFQALVEDSNCPTWWETDQILFDLPWFNLEYLSRWNLFSTFDSRRTKLFLCCLWFSKKTSSILPFLSFFILTWDPKLCMFSLDESIFAEKAFDLQWKYPASYFLISVFFVHLHFLICWFLCFALVLIRKTSLSHLNQQIWRRVIGQMQKSTLLFFLKKVQTFATKW